MEEILAICGYRCDLCPLYAKNIGSEEDKERLSQDYSRIFGFDITPEDVECVGCKNEGHHPDSGCPVRPCALAKGVENCAHCGDFMCDKLLTKTDFIEEFLSKNEKPLSDEDIQLYVKPYQSKERLLKIRQQIDAEESQ